MSEYEGVEEALNAEESLRQIEEVKKHLKVFQQDSSFVKSMSDGKARARVMDELWELMSEVGNLKQEVQEKVQESVANVVRQCVDVDNASLNGNVDAVVKAEEASLKPYLKTIEDKLTTHDGELRELQKILPRQASCKLVSTTRMKRLWHNVFTCVIGVSLSSLFSLNGEDSERTNSESCMDEEEDVDDEEYEGDGVDGDTNSDTTVGAEACDKEEEEDDEETTVSTFPQFLNSAAQEQNGNHVYWTVLYNMFSHLVELYFDRLSDRIVRDVLVEDLSSLLADLSSIPASAAANVNMLALYEFVMKDTSDGRRLSGYRQIVTNFNVLLSAFDKEIATHVRLLVGAKVLSLYCFGKLSTTEDQSYISEIFSKHQTFELLKFGGSCSEDAPYHSAVGYFCTSEVGAYQIGLHYETSFQNSFADGEWVLEFSGSNPADLVAPLQHTGQWTGKKQLTASRLAVFFARAVVRKKALDCHDLGSETTWVRCCKGKGFVLPPEDVIPALSERCDDGHTDEVGMKFLRAGAMISTEVIDSCTNVKSAAVKHLIRRFSSYDDEYRKKGVADLFSQHHLLTRAGELVRSSGSVEVSRRWWDSTLKALASTRSWFHRFSELFSTKYQAPLNKALGQATRLKDKREELDEKRRTRLDNAAKRGKAKIASASRPKKSRPNKSKNVTVKAGTSSSRLKAFFV